MVGQGPPAKVAEYDAANAETAEIATEMETRASKIISYVNDWEHSSTEEQNRLLILALADRLDPRRNKMERNAKTSGHITISSVVSQ
jgi:hypothetical protein